MKRALFVLLALPILAAAQAPRLIPAPREFTAGSATPLKGAVAVVSGTDRDDKFAAADPAAGAGAGLMVS